MGAKNKTVKTSSLEAIEGIGAAKAKALLAHFKSLSAVKKATLEELCAVPGVSSALAEKIVSHFNKTDGE